MFASLRSYYLDDRFDQDESGSQKQHSFDGLMQEYGRSLWSVGPRTSLRSEPKMCRLIRAGSFAAAFQGHGKASLTSLVKEVLIRA